MCGIVGYIGNASSQSIILHGLTSLEYRGYDAAGIACLDEQQKTITTAKALGPLDNLKKELTKTPLRGTVGIGHIRWATHGQLSLANTHPFFDCSRRIAIVHNGIFENQYELKQRLAHGHQFVSDVDTEVVTHLFEEIEKKGCSLPAAISELAGLLEGTYACVIMMKESSHIVAIRKRAPLCIGMANSGMTVASDVAAFADEVKKVLFLPDETFALIGPDAVSVYTFQGDEITVVPQAIAQVWTQADKGGHAHFMLKEMYEQKDAIETTIRLLDEKKDSVWCGMGLRSEQIKQLKKINLIGCGTSWHAGRIAKFFFETVARIPTAVHLASEFRVMPFFAESNSIYLGVSQSGETADTLEALRLVTEADLPTVAVANVGSSTMVRQAGGSLLTHAGKEIAVASTKAFTTQLALFYWLAHRIALERNLISLDDMQRAIQWLIATAEVLQKSIDVYKQEIIYAVKERYAHYYKRYIFLGRHVSYICALEAALKLKEISYIFSIGYPAGELKHGPIALIDEHTPVVLFSHSDRYIYKKLVSNAQEVKARRGHLVSFAFQGQDELIELSDWSIVFPCPPDPLLGALAMSGVIQFFTYQIALQRECDIDKPRNLAKSVTVE